MNDRESRKDLDYQLAKALEYLSRGSAIMQRMDEYAPLRAKMEVALKEVHTLRMSVYRRP